MCRSVKAVEQSCNDEQIKPPIYQELHTFKLGRFKI